MAQAGQAKSKPYVGQRLELPNAEAGSNQGAAKEQAKGDDVW